MCNRVFGEFFAPLVSYGKPHSKPSATVKIVKNTLNFLLQYVVSSETPSFVRRIILSSLRNVVTQVWVVHDDMLAVVIENSSFIGIHIGSWESSTGLRVYDLLDV